MENKDRGGNMNSWWKNFEHHSNTIDLFTKMKIAKLLNLRNFIKSTLISR